MNENHIGPTTVKDYYRALQNDYNKELKSIIEELESVEKSNNFNLTRLNHHISFYKKNLGIDLNKYEEYNTNKHIDGSLYKECLKIHRNEKDEKYREYTIILLRYSQSLERKFELNNRLVLVKKVLSYTYKQYTAFLKAYYYEVQRQMIVNGNAYEFLGDIGAVCINRCRNLKRVPMLDSKASRENKKRLMAEGKEIYDARKAAYCADRNIPYEGVDYRIFKRNNYLYEFPLIWSGLVNSFKYKFEPIDKWDNKLRGKTKEDFKRESNGNLNYICNLDITFRTKVSICIELDETLYLNFIRNEHQTPVTTSKNHR